MKAKGKPYYLPKIPIQRPADFSGGKREAHMPHRRIIHLWSKGCVTGPHDRGRSSCLLLFPCHTVSSLTFSFQHFYGLANHTSPVFVGIAGSPRNEHQSVTLSCHFLSQLENPRCQLLNRKVGPED